ncbi:Berardinelli-Seip congenital lipodystrophy 2 (seipin) [Podila epigama]|nr:Berardinelli-Seip congenital lipodystrophy 2 (seipin) [Podila epigama]
MDYDNAKDNAKGKDKDMVLSFFISPLFRLLEPYVQQVTQTLTSSALHRKVVKFLISLVVLVLLVGVSVAAYLSFYWIYIPQRGHVGQLHLQYEKPTLANVVPAGPSAEIDFSRGGRYGQFLRADQAYDISVSLNVPTSEQNVAIGNFMVVVTLLRADGRTIMTSSRPAILTYHSQPLRLMKTAWKAVPLVLDWSQEDQVLKVPLIENFVEDAANPVSRAYIEISHPGLQVYRSAIHIDAHFHGLRYFMYYWKVSTALVFMSVFIFWEIIFSVVTWQVLAGWFGSDAEALAIAHQIHPHTDAHQGQAHGDEQQQQTQQQQQQQQQDRQQALRAPTLYQGNTTSRDQIQSIAQPPRQPQLQESHQHSTLQRTTDSESDRDFEEEEEEQRVKDERKSGRRFTSGKRSSKNDQGSDRDVMGDEADAEDLDLEHLDRRFLDDAVVPEAPALGATSSSLQVPLIQQQRRQGQGSHPSGPYVEDGSSSAGGSTTSSRRTVRSGGVASNMNMSMASSTSSSLPPPPPPPPSVRSEPSTDLRMSPHHTAVESEYTEEDEDDEDGYPDAEEEDDDTETGVGDIAFEEEDFTEAALRSPGGTSLSNRSQGARREARSTTANIGRSTGRSGGH